MALVDALPLDVDAQEREFVACLEDLRGFPRHAIVNAYFHLAKARIISAIDVQMTLLRVLTAEEEAVASLFLVLRQRKYRNSDRLKFRSHVHKLGLIPFLEIVGMHLGSLKPARPLKLRATTIDGARRLQLGIGFGERWGWPTPPLGFFSTDEASRRVYLFERELKEFLRGSSSGDFKEELKRVAAVRHQLLYASAEGVPGLCAADSESLCAEGERRVLFLSYLIGLIYPYQDRALFVQQVLDAFLKATEQIESEWQSWVAPEVPTPGITPPL